MTRDESIRSPFRPVRPVGAQDAPWPGMLACLATGERRLLVDAALLGPEWHGWEAAADGHVVGALEVMRRADGHDVVLPVFSERVIDMLTHRLSTSPLTDGEAVTLGVSILRGCAQLLERPAVTGEWWLTEDGRPVLATDVSDRAAFAGAIELLTDVADASRHPQVWSDAIGALTADRPVVVELDRAEQLLFELADPVPLTTAASPLPARAAVVRESASIAVDPSPPPPMWHALTRHVDADLADLVSRTTTAIWRRARTRERASGKPWVIGGVAAAVVLGLGLLWPTTDGGVATADGRAGSDAIGDAPVPPATPAPAATTAPAVTSTAGEADSTDLVVIAGALLDRRLDCAGDDGCLATVMQDPGTAVGPGPIDLSADERSIALLDDFGGVAVLRVDGTAEPRTSQLLVIALRDDEWLLRDVHDVAQQP